MDSTTNPRRNGSSDGPVFITGQPRSGTTLMHVIVNNHPRIALAPRDREWWTRTYPRYRRLRSQARWTAFLDELFAIYRTRILNLDLAALRKRTDQLRIGDFAGVFELLLTAYAEAQGRPRWGEKTPMSYLWHRQILAAYPDSQVIHMIRDPRDVCSSIRAVRFTQGLQYWLMTSPTVSTLEWRESVRIADRNQRQNPHRYLKVRYEDLVAQPGAVVETVCAFLGEAPAEGMLDLSGFPTKGRQTNSSFDSFFGIQTVSVGRSVKTLTPIEVRICEWIAGGELKRQGYEPFDVTMRPADRLRLFAAALIGMVQATLYAGIRLARWVAPSYAEPPAVFGDPPAAHTDVLPQSNTSAE
jgi:hypothetical protein